MQIFSELATPIVSSLIASYPMHMVHLLTNALAKMYVYWSIADMRMDTTSFLGLY